MIDRDSLYRRGFGFAPIIMTTRRRPPAIGVEIKIMNQPSPSVGTCLDVQSFINAQPLSRYQWRVVILCFLIVFLDGLDTAAMGFIAPALSQDWGSTVPASAR